MHRFEHRRIGSGGVDIAAGGQTDSATDGGGEVGDDIAEQVVGDDDVEASRIGDHINRGRINVLIGHLDIRVLGTDLGHHARPQTAREGQHVGLVDQCQVFAPLARQSERIPHHPVDAERGVEADLRGHLVRGSGADHAAISGVGTLGTLAHDDEIDSRCAGERTGHAVVKPARAQVHVMVEFKAGLEQQTALEHTAGHRRVTNSAEQDCVMPA